MPVLSAKPPSTLSPPQFHVVCAWYGEARHPQNPKLRTLWKFSKIWRLPHGDAVERLGSRTVCFGLFAFGVGGSKFRAWGFGVEGFQLRVSSQSTESSMFQDLGSGQKTTAQNTQPKKLPIPDIEPSATVMNAQTRTALQNTNSEPLIVAQTI